MTDSLDDFLDFGEDHNDAFADEYANLSRCDGSPSSEDVELNPLEDSISALSTNGMDQEMTEFALGASLGSSWARVNDSFSQMQVKTDAKDKTGEKSNIFDDAVSIPGSWPVAKGALKPNMLRNREAVAQETQMLQPTSFTLSQIAPPSLPQERSNSTTTSSICSEAIKEEDESATHDSDLTEPARKRRASETVRKAAAPTKAVHKRANSNASAMVASFTETALATPVGVELDESGDPIVAKRQDRLMRNRAAALASRERKREHVNKLETSVVDLENDKSNLQKQVVRMHDEILRLRQLLDEHEIEDKQAVDLSDVVSAMKTEPEEAPVEVESGMTENPAIARTRNAPTGFSPRGALKKSEIIANHIRAEEHLRNITMKQTGVCPPPRPLIKEEPNDATISAGGGTAARSLPVTIHRQGKGAGANGSVVFMILIFGIALFANTNTSGGLNLKGFSRDPSSSGLLLNLPQNFGEVCPETVISQLRGQGFMLSEEIEELEARNLLTADTRAGSVSSTSSTVVSETDVANWVTTHDGGDVDYEVGKSFTIAAPTNKANKVTITKRKESVDDKQWRILECEIKKIQDLSMT